MVESKRILALLELAPACADLVGSSGLSYHLCRQHRAKGHQGSSPVHSTARTLPTQSHSQCCQRHLPLPVPSPVQSAACALSMHNQPVPNPQLPVLMPWGLRPKSGESRSKSRNMRGFPQGGWVSSAKGIEWGAGLCRRAQEPSLGAVVVLLRPAVVGIARAPQPRLLC